MDLDIREELQKKEEINRRQERELIAAYEKLQVAISMAGIIFCEYDMKQGLFIFRTESYKKIGLHSNVLTVAEVEADTVTIWPEDNYKILDALKALQNGESNIEIECRMWTEKGYRWHKGIYNAIWGEGEKPESAYICFYDIHETKIHELESNSRAEKDLMTGLLNRKTFEDVVTENIERQKENNARGVFLLIDIDNFKHVNDCYGHSFGDEVITYIGNALQEIFLKDAFASRMGGDEFGIFVLNTADREKITGDVEKFYYIVDAFSNTQNKNISCSVGIAFQEEPSDTFHCLYKKADEALYMAKYLGKGQYFVYGDA